MDSPSPDHIIKHILSLPDSSYPPLQRHHIRATLQAVLTDSQASISEEARMAKHEIYVQMLEEQWRRQGKSVPLPLEPKIPDMKGIGSDIAAAQTYNPITRGVFGRKLFCSHWLRTGECDFTQQGCNYLHIMPDVDTMQKLNMKSYPRWFREMPHAYQQTNSFELDEQAIVRGSLEASAANNEKPHRRGGRAGKAKPSRAGGRRRSPHSRSGAKPGDLKRKRHDSTVMVYERSPSPPGKRPHNHRFRSAEPSEAGSAFPRGRSPAPSSRPQSRQVSSVRRRSRSPAPLATPQPRRPPPRSPSILTSFGTPAPDSLPPRPMSVLTTFTGSLGTGSMAYEPDFSASILDDYSPSLQHKLDLRHETRILHPPASEHQYPGHVYPSNRPFPIPSWGPGPNASAISQSQPGQFSHAPQMQAHNLPTFPFAQPQRSGSFLKEPQGKHPLPRNPMLPPPQPQPSSDAIDLTRSHPTNPAGTSDNSERPIMRDAAGQPVVFKGTGFHINVVTDDELASRPPPGPKPGTLAYLQSQRSVQKRGVKRPRIEEPDEEVQQEFTIDDDFGARFVPLPDGDDTDEGLSDTPTDMQVEY